MRATLLFAHDGGVQITLTGENEVENAVLKLLLLADYDIAVRSVIGEVGRTQGEFYREFDHRPKSDSTGIVLTPKKAAT